VLPHGVPYVPTPEDSPFARLGRESGVRSIVQRFYEIMSQREPALARLHPCDADGRVAAASQERFASFFVGWLGGPQDYVAQHGHPRLRMRHARVPVDEAMAAAWLRCMGAAFDEAALDPEVRAFLDGKLGDLALFLRNRG
jgi:hemoglobin